MTRQLVKRDFPELADVTLRFSSMRGDAFFFAMKPSLRRTLAPRGDGAFIVRVNPAALDGTLSDAAAKAVLAHELAHVSHFEACGHVATAQAAWANTLGKKRALPRIERRTDIEAIIRGHGPGLAEYRRWQYGRLSSDDLKVKKHTYLTPEEITAIDAALKQHPALRAVWLKDPPLSLADVERDVRAQSWSARGPR